MSKELPHAKTIEEILGLLDASETTTLGDLNAKDGGTGRRRLFAGRLAPLQPKPETDGTQENVGFSEDSARSLGGIPLGSSEEDWGRHFTGMEEAALGGRASLTDALGALEALTGTVVFHQNEEVPGVAGTAKTDPFDDISWVNK